MEDRDFSVVEADISELFGQIPAPGERQSTRADEVSVTDTASSRKEEEGFANKKVCNRALDSEEINPLHHSYIGVPVNYFLVGIMLAGSSSILYPILVVKEGVSSALLTASYSVVSLFWSYKIVFGFMSDCFPILGWKRKPYVALGWILCAAFLAAIASMGDNVTSGTLVMVLALANACYVMANVASDGVMVLISHREPMHKRGRMQTLIYGATTAGQIFINSIVLFSFSGPALNCPGYEPDPGVQCTTDDSVKSRNELADYEDDWCHMICSGATFAFDLTITQYAWIVVFLIVMGLPFYFMLKENKAPREQLRTFMTSFWRQMKRRASWQITLYSMTSNITFGVVNAAKVPANFVWLDFKTSQNQFMLIMEKMIFFFSLYVVREYTLHVSWRKLIWCGTLLITFFQCLYFFIVFDIWRSSWFYIFIDVSTHCIYTLNFIASLSCMVEVAEPGFEAITYSLTTTASSTVAPLSSVISFQLMAFFPKLNTQEYIAADTPEVRNEFAALHLITMIINLSSLLAVPMLPRQKKETRDLIAAGETSGFWGCFVLVSAFVFLIYSTVFTFITVASSDVYGCFKIFGGGGCSPEESSGPVLILVALVLLYCYVVNFYHSFWHMVTSGRNSVLSKLCC